jgi:transcription elongation factor GreA
MVTRVPMTVTGAERLREELEQLKRVERPRISKAIAEAREHGDLRENAEYHAAREQQSFVEGRIKDIEAKLSVAQIIDVRAIKPSGKVIFGSTVEIIDLATDAKLRYQIVREGEPHLGHLTDGALPGRQGSRRRRHRENPRRRSRIRNHRRPPPLKRGQIYFPVFRREEN